MVNNYTLPVLPCSNNQQIVAKVTTKGQQPLAVKVPEHEETLMTIAEQLRQEGRQEGREEAKYEMARSMLLTGIDRDTVITVTGLSAEAL